MTSPLNVFRANASLIFSAANSRLGFKVIVLDLHVSRSTRDVDFAAIIRVLSWNFVWLAHA